jgi:hypothetical protein
LTAGPTHHPWSPVMLSCSVQASLMKATIHPSIRPTVRRHTSLPSSAGTWCMPRCQIHSPSRIDSWPINIMHAQAAKCVKSCPTWSRVQSRTLAVPPQPHGIPTSPHLTSPTHTYPCLSLLTYVCACLGSPAHPYHGTPDPTLSLTEPVVNAFYCESLPPTLPRRQGRYIITRQIRHATGPEI